MLAALQARPDERHKHPLPSPPSRESCGMPAEFEPILAQQACPAGEPSKFAWSGTLWKESYPVRDASERCDDST